MKIVANTVFTPYNQNTKIKPTAPVWLIKNTGFYDVFINETIRLTPGSFFGLDAQPLLIPVVQSQMKANGNGEKIEIEMDTEFSLSFPTTATAGTYTQVTLIQTFYHFKKG